MPTAASRSTLGAPLGHRSSWKPSAACRRSAKSAGAFLGRGSPQERLRPATSSRFCATSSEAPWSPTPSRRVGAAEGGVLTWLPPWSPTSASASNVAPLRCVLASS
eukprot:13811245-Alexandrium_andersonii.AAC.1